MICLSFTNNIIYKIWFMEEGGDFMEYLRKHPKFQATGYVDEDGFYRQPDRSNMKGNYIN